MILLVVDNKATKVLTELNEKKVSKWLYENFNPWSEVKVYDGEIGKEPIDTLRVDELFNNPEA